MRTPGQTLKKLVVGITFFYDAERLRYLQGTCAHLSALADDVHVYIFTNTQDEAEQASVAAAVQPFGFKYTLCVPNLLGHPYLLPWCHLSVFRELFARDASITHFMYVEDDIVVDSTNISYWLEGRERLGRTRFYPSFLRYECERDGDVKYSTDVIERCFLNEVAQIPHSPEYCYISLRYPYQGMYFYDRPLMEEFLNRPAADLDSNGRWGIREKATQGLTFVRVPKGFASRSLVGFDTRRATVDPRCLVHHQPNNYMNRLDSPHGKIPCGALVGLRRSKA